MSIQVTCPNGHQFRAKDHWAGRTGRCPKCRAPIKVPAAPADISDDDALAMISEGDSPPPEPVAVPDKPSDDESNDESKDDAHVLDEYETQLEIATSGLSLLGSGVIGDKKVCKNCGKEANHWSASCGHCGTYFDGSE